MEYPNIDTLEEDINQREKKFINYLINFFPIN